MDNDLHYKFVTPIKPLADFIQSFWLFENHSHINKKVIALPDGRVDLLLLKSASESFNIYLLGIGTQPDKLIIAPKTLIYAVSFKLLAIEFILNSSIADLVNSGMILPKDFWDFTANDLNDFDAFCKKTTEKIQSLLPKEMDSRKQKLFELMYASKGEITVKDFAEKVFWSSRQINRYFNQQFGLSLKSYCNILRFRASLEHIAEGKLFPELDFADQNHFIRQVKKFSGVVPKELFKNQNDRFVLLSTFAQK